MIERYSDHAANGAPRDEFRHRARDLAAAARDDPLCLPDRHRDRATVSGPRTRLPTVSGYEAVYYPDKPGELLADDERCAQALTPRGGSHAGDRRCADPVMNSYRGTPRTLGNAAVARVRLICVVQKCGHQVEPDLGGMVEPHGAEMMIPDWHTLPGRCRFQRSSIVVSSGGGRFCPL